MPKLGWFDLKVNGKDTVTRNAQQMDATQKQNSQSTTIRLVKLQASVKWGGGGSEQKQNDFLKGT